MIKEQLLSFDKFSQPTEIDGVDTVAILLIRLILLEPGTIQMAPKMGIGLIRNWRYCDEEDLPNLEKEIEEQINAYLPSLALTAVEVFYQSKVLILQVALSKGTYVLKTSTGFDTVELDKVLQ